MSPSPAPLTVRPDNLRDARDALMFLNRLELDALEHRTATILDRLHLSTVPATTAFRIALVQALGELADEHPQPATHEPRPS